MDYIKGRYGYQPLRAGDTTVPNDTAIKSPKKQITLDQIYYTLLDTNDLLREILKRSPDHEVSVKFISDNR